MAEEVVEREAWVYIVECADHTLYTGWCYDVAERIAAHNAGRGAKYTRGRRPVQLRWAEPQPTRRAALQREAAIKRLSRPAKLRLLAESTLGGIERGKEP